MNQLPLNCPDCGDANLSRRSFLKATAGIAAASALPAWAAPSPASKSETLVTTLYKSLSEEQRGKLCFAFDHPLRSKVDANWMINEPQKALLKADQQAMVRDIFNGLHSPEYAE